MRCLCCNKELKPNDNNIWHKSCIYKFFKSEEIPELDLSKEKIKEIADNNVNLGYTVPGVQKKLSLNIFSNKDKKRLTLINYPSGYILKPQVDNFKSLPEAEQLVMSLANMVNIKTVPHGLIKLKSGEYAYITKRIDRIVENNKVKLIAMEDFCQLGQRLSIDKYHGSYEKCAKIIKEYSSQVMLDLSELFYRLVFFFITGNSDMHLKNFSLIEVKDNKYILSPCYDLVPVNVVMSDDKEELALTLNGKKQNLRRSDFIKFGEFIDLNLSSMDKIINYLVSFEDKFINEIKLSLIDDNQKNRFITLIKDRISRLK
jgi:serine/threonine-protein kinase HipA